MEKRELTKLIAAIALFAVAGGIIYFTLFREKQPPKVEPPAGTPAASNAPAGTAPKAGVDEGVNARPGSGPQAKPTSPVRVNPDPG